MFDAKQYAKDFPILKRLIHGTKPLIYLDNAATSQKPIQVIDAISEYYKNNNANVHRGIHQLGDESTKAFHAARQTIASFFGAEPEELIAVRNTTEAINQVAYTWGEANISAGDVILTTEMEHHSNIVPWQQLAKRKKAMVQYVSVMEDGRLDIADLHRRLQEYHPKLVAFNHVSNTLGTLNSIEEVVHLVEEVSPDTKILVDGAQAAPHLKIDFKKLGVDFYTMSAHKMLGPMGIGGLLVKKKLLEDMTPFLFGGGMIQEVSLDDTLFAEDMEERFTAGTPDVAGLVGWAAACEYISKIGMENILLHDQQLITYTLEQLLKMSQIHVVGPTIPEKRVGSVAFIYEGVHAHDVSQILDSEGIAVRSGQHCTMPLHMKYDWGATTRVSFQLYNTTEEIDIFLEALKKVAQIFGK